MNKKLYYIVAGLLMASCSDDKQITPVDPSVSEGSEVTFLIGNSSAESRTMYAQDGWESEDAKSQTIFWGDYLQSGDYTNIKGNDQIRVFCNEAVTGRQIATYDVTPSPTGSNVAEAVTRSAGQAAGVQWGAQGEHNFYAFYPATHCEASFSGGTPGIITAQIEVGQSPCTYKVVRNGQTIASGSHALADLGTNQGTAVAGDITTIYGQPDMGAAVMAAKTVVSANDYGKPVSLNFSVLADVLDLTINGPITPNNLNGDKNASQADWKAKESIHIKNVLIESSGNPIAGNFTLDLTNYDSKNMTGYTINVINGSNTIQLSTAQSNISETTSEVNYPLLHIRSNANTEVDKLRLRAFLLPGQISNLQDLTVTVQTDCGDYTQKLGSQSVVKGQIHRVKFPYFEQAGFSFKFDSWISQLDPDIYISELSYPGAWNCYSSNYQSKAVADQYAAGVRAFQINLSTERNVLTSHPEPFITDQRSTTFTTVLNNMGSYMEGHKDEFIILNISRKAYDGLGFVNDQPASWYGKVLNVVNNNNYVYKGPVTAETTISDVKGKIIVILDYDGATSSSINGFILPWNDVFATAATASVTDLCWATQGNTAQGMKMCISEADNVGTASKCQATVATRQASIRDYISKSLAQYSTGSHNTLFQLGIGGYANDNKDNLTSARGIANTFNPYVNALLSDPNRQACPMGFVLMNFAGDSNYNGADIITTIINNNRAFTLQKKGSGRSSAKDKTNANFPTGHDSSVE